MNQYTSPLSGWHAYPVFCNRSLIASFPTEALQQQFIAQRRARYPQNHYDDYPQS